MTRWHEISRIHASIHCGDVTKLYGHWLPLLSERSVRLVYLGLSVRTCNSKTTAPIDNDLLTQEVFYPWLTPSFMMIRIWLKNLLNDSWALRDRTKCAIKDAVTSNVRYDDKMHNDIKGASYRARVCHLWLACVCWLVVDGIRVWVHPVDSQTFTATSPSAHLEYED